MVHGKIIAVGDSDRNSTKKKINKKKRSTRKSTMYTIFISTKKFNRRRAPSRCFVFSRDERPKKKKKKCKNETYSHTRPFYTFRLFISSIVYFLCFRVSLSVYENEAGLRFVGNLRNCRRNADCV